MIFFKVGRLSKNVITCLPPNYHAFHKVWLNWMKTMGAVAF